MSISMSIDSRIATIVLDREPVNAFRTRDYAELADLVRSAADDTQVSCLKILSARHVFSAGADTKELRELVGTGDLDGDRRRQTIVAELFRVIRAAAVPVVAGVDGPALGAGAVIAACADICIASSRAMFGLPEVRVGRCGGGSHLRTHLPEGWVRYMAFTGDPIDGSEAYRLGLVQELVAPGAVAAKSDDLARRIAVHSSTGLRLMKAALRDSDGLGVEAGYAIEQEYSMKYAATEAAREALGADVKQGKYS